MDKTYLEDDLLECNDDDKFNLDDLDDLEIEEEFDEEETPPSKWSSKRKQKQEKAAKRERPPKQRKEKKAKVTEAKMTKTKRMFSSHAYIGGACLAFAFLVILILQPLITGVIGGQVDVVRAKETISAGSKITKENIEVVKVNRASIPANAICAEEEALNKFSDAKLVAGDYLMRTKLNDNQFGGGIYLEGLDGSKRIISIAIPDFASGLSAKLKAGDIVTVYGATPSGSDRAIYYPELKYVKVLATTLENGVDESDAASGSTEQPSTVTMLVNDAQAQLLSGLNGNGRLHIVLAYRGEQENADKFLQEQENVLRSESIK